MSDHQSAPTVPFAPDTIAPTSVGAALPEGRSWLKPSVAQDPRLGWLRGNLGRWVIALGTASYPMHYADPLYELRRSGASAVEWQARRGLGVVISAHEARALAIAIMAATERRLAEERTKEARFLLSIWDTD